MLQIKSLDLQFSDPHFSALWFQLLNKLKEASSPEAAITLTIQDSPGAYKRIFSGLDGLNELPTDKQSYYIELVACDDQTKITLTSDVI
ncbi:hypothetical protein MKQ68_18795 [Chitinophaga horti]|uniref:Uncharacterized protein n=1 Tax=Chitinophaga horti TaxID=2920382 RepID=A0ABY6J1Q4_9BACT|nr:hypothetical protein [Chitinophaga horti]UYQ92139.1 hypothetical protein MKQ68_18795 [Chitinophaga horti]